MELLSSARFSLPSELHFEPRGRTLREMSESRSTAAEGTASTFLLLQQLSEIIEKTAHWPCGRCSEVNREERNAQPPTSVMHVLPRERREHVLVSIYLASSSALGCSHFLVKTEDSPSAIARLKDIRKLFSRRRHVSDDEVRATRSADDIHSQSSCSTCKHRMAEPVATHDAKDYTEGELYHLVNEAKDYQITHGSLLKVVEYETESSVPARPVGVSILPTPFPRKCWEEAVELQHIFNELYMRAASDEEWLYSVIGPLIQHDSLVAALWNVYLEVKKAGKVQNIVCGLFRSDYMLHQTPDCPDPFLKQVEMNTFSCAGAAHAQRVADMHSHLKLIRDPGHASNSSKDLRFPGNTNVKAVVSMLKAAHEAYTPGGTKARPKCILMPVQPYNFNIADERPIEYGLRDFGIPCYRCEWRAALDRTTLAEDRTLLFRPTFAQTEYEVTVVYYRAGYAAEEYRDLGMEARLRFELSRAIKSPDVLTNLTTFKAVQQALTQPGAVERFVPAEKAEKVRKTFMPMLTMDSSPAGLEARAIALDPKQAVNYVLKPNLEGGGHNIYRSDIPNFLSSKSKESWHKYILMRLIEPPPSIGTLMMPQDLYHGATVSEVGILGACLWERKDGEVEIKLNDSAGWNFKTKPAEVDEMSVVKGFGCFDCPLLVK